jgi:hypothetical protein
VRNHEFLYGPVHPVDSAVVDLIGYDQISGRHALSKMPQACCLGLVNVNLKQ